MYNFKGFANISTLVNNVDGTVAPVGEISAQSATFSREVKVYSTGGPATVHCFKSYSTIRSESIIPSAAIVDNVTEVIDWVHQRQSVLTAAETVTEFKLALTARFGAQISDIQVPSMITSSTGRSYPASLSWSCTAYTTETNQIKIWFNDTLFQQEYDEYELVVIPPVGSIDALAGNYSSALSSLAAESMVSVFSRIQTARGGYPETQLVTKNYSLVNASNVTVNTDTNWYILVYGPRGNNEDLIRSAIIKYLSDSSNVTLTKWKTVYPDVFTVTEFIIVPMWNKYAVTPRTITAGVNSQVCTLSSQISYMQRAVPSYPEGHISNFMQTVPHPYYNLLLSVVGSPENRSSKFLITDFYADLISVSTTSADYGRMTVSTQGLLQHITRMLVLASSMTDATDIPVDYKRSVRDGISYITVTYENVTYLIATKATAPVN